MKYFRFWSPRRAVVAAVITLLCVYAAWVLAFAYAWGGTPMPLVLWVIQIFSALPLFLLWFTSYMFLALLVSHALYTLGWYLVFTALSAVFLRRRAPAAAVPLPVAPDGQVLTPDSSIATTHGFRNSLVALVVVFLLWSVGVVLHPLGGLGALLDPLARNSNLMDARREADRSATGKAAADAKKEQLQHPVYIGCDTADGECWPDSWSGQYDYAEPHEAQGIIAPLMGADYRVLWSRSSPLEAVIMNAASGCVTMRYEDELSITERFGDLATAPGNCHSLFNQDYGEFVQFTTATRQWSGGRNAANVWHIISVSADPLVPHVSLMYGYQLTEDDIKAVAALMDALNRP